MSREIDLTYTSSNGTEFPLVTTEMYLKNASMHEYTWNPEAITFKYGDLLKAFTKDSLKLNLTVAFSGAIDDIEDLIKDFHDAIETDVLTETAGKLTYNGYEIECYIISSKIYPGAMNTRTLNDLTIYCPYPFWTKETQYSFSLTGTALVDAANFPMNLPANLGISGYRKTITVDSSLPYEFRLVISGPVENPSITINGHIYNVNATIPTGALLSISSIERSNIEKAIYLLYPSGNAVNMFHKRNKSSYIFEPITGPTVIVSSAQEMDFELYLIERRSEPLWT